MRSFARVLLVTSLAAGLAAPLTGATPALAGCARDSGRAISGTVTGQDGLDVNVSIGFDVVDANHRPINADPATPSDFGCAKNGSHGGYSVRQREFNHFVTGNGTAAGTLQRNGQRTTRTWTLGHLPSNAAAVWIEVYSRGYTGSPCTTSFNPSDVHKYGYANRQYVPVGATRQNLVLPLTCAYAGKTGTISGRVVSSTGAAYALRSVYAWTSHPYNVGPYPQGWGSARLGASTGSFSIAALAGAQPYSVWATTTSGRTIKRLNVLVHGCQNTSINVSG